MTGITRRGKACRRCLRLGRPCGTCLGPAATTTAAAATTSDLADLAEIAEFDVPTPPAPPDPYDGWEQRPSPAVECRHVAAQTWPQVQRQATIAPGVTWFHSAGHGGVVAEIGTADLDPAVVEAARGEGLVDTYYKVSPGPGKTPVRYGPSRHYDESRLEDWIAQNAERGYDVARVDYLVGEEDSDWAVVMLAAGPDTLTRAQGSVLSDATTTDDIVDRVRDHYPDLWTAVSGETVTADQSQVVARREFTAAHQNDFVSTSARGSWADGVPDGSVEVTARRLSDGTETRWHVPTDTYRQAGRFGYVINPDTDTQVA